MYMSTTSKSGEKADASYEIRHETTENAFQRRSRQAGYEGKTATTVAEAERQLE